VVSLAIAEPTNSGHARVGTEHLLLGLLADADSDTAALRAAGALAGRTVAEVVTEVVNAGRRGVAVHATPSERWARQPVRATLPRSRGQRQRGSACSTSRASPAR
jgi:hypothetical protein